jgi:DNA-binding winged helix-turn-helix (wHTH) protein
LLFIQRQGEVVDKETLIHECWGKYGVMVTEGSMWKSISQLRQMFQNLGITFEVIVTVPRLGYTFTSEMQVRELLPGELKGYQTGVPLNKKVEDPITDAPTAKVQDGEQNHESRAPEPVALRDLTVTRALPSPLHKIRDTLAAKNYRKLGVLLAAILVSNLVAAGLMWHHVTQNKTWGVFNSTQQYRHIATQGETQIFLQNSVDEKMLFSTEAQTRFAQKPVVTLTGKKPAYLYINKVASHGLSSYFICDLPLSQAKNHCSAYFILTGQENL